MEGGLNGEATDFLWRLYADKKVWKEWCILPVTIP
ncbi:hypothetical protein ACVJBD_007679 [Rhizobium mongolense]